MNLSMSLFSSVTAAIAAAAAASYRAFVVITIFTAALAQEGREDGEQAAHVLTMTLRADNIVGMLVIDQHLKFGFTVRAIVLVQRHENDLHLLGTPQFKHILVAGEKIVKSKCHLDVSSVIC